MSSDASARSGNRKEDARLAGLRDLDGRDVAALTEPMNVFADDPEAGLDEVAVYHRGDRKIVNVEVGYCTCGDWHFRQPDGGCKHLRRVAVLTGDRPIPTWIPDVVDIDTRIGANVDKNVRFVQTDGGVVTNTDSDDGTDTDADVDADVWSEPQLETNKYHEPTGEKYVWCRNCGVEVLVGETDNASHGPGCIHWEGER